MTNVLFKELIDRYNKKAYTHHYIWGFIYKKVVYMAHTTEEIMPYICTLDRASRGQGYSLRFSPRNDQKLLLMPNAIPLCSEEFFKSEVANSKYNKGEIFEKMVTESNGIEWKKDNVDFTKDGDLTVNGISFQIKFQRATFCNEKSLANLNC